MIRGAKGKFLFRFAVLVSVGVFPAISFCSALDDEVSSLRAKCISNVEAIKTVKFTAVTGVEVPSATNKTRAMAAADGGDAVTWDRKGGKFKWKRSGAGVSAYSIDASKGTLSYLGPDSASVFVEDIAVSDALEKAVPTPRWLWNPSWLIPGRPASVRREGGAVIVVSSTANPKREIKMEAVTGHILGFTDTDAKGNTVRVVDVGGWAEHNGVWLPGTVREEIRGEKGTIVRNTSISVSAINSVLGEADFALP